VLVVKVVHRRQIETAKIIIQFRKRTIKAQIWNSVVFFAFDNKMFFEKKSDSSEHAGAFDQNERDLELKKNFFESATRFRLDF